MSDTSTASERRARLASPTPPPLLKGFLEDELNVRLIVVGRAPGNSHLGWVYRSEDNAKRLVVRMEPDAGPFLSYDARAEGSLLKTLRARGIPVPRVLASGGTEIAGAPFIALEWIDGKVLTPQSLTKCSSESRERRAVELARTLAKIHSITVDPVDSHNGGIGLVRRQSLDEYLDEFEALLDGATNVSSAVLDFTLAWLRRNPPRSDVRPVLLHGDFRLGNLVWNDDRIVGVLDWETARIGEPGFDLAWLSMGATGREDPVMGLVPRHRFLELYRQECVSSIDEHNLTHWQIVAAWVRGCTEVRLLSIAISEKTPGATDPRNLSWEFGSARTDQEILTLIEALETRGD